MDGTRLRILIIGGYGVFGGRLARLLSDEPRVELIIAGRSLEQAETFCRSFVGQALSSAAQFDRNGDVIAQMKAIAPDIVVDASGPFQTYGGAPYKVVEAALALAIPYMDLADGSDFVEGIARFDEAARDSGVFLLSGVSSFPVLTVAVCRKLAVGLDEIEAINGGIAPSPFAAVGLNVIRAISGYAGKPVALRRDGQQAVGYGLTETMRFTIAPPGYLPLKSTLFSLVDVPDLKVLPKLWPGVGSVWMGAGPVPAILHRGLIGLAWLVRVKLLPSLSWLARLFHWAINVNRWGEHRGGMFVRLTGRAAGGQTVERCWHLVAEGDDGPYIPSMAVEAIVRKCLAGERPPNGARPATGDLELEDYDVLFRRRRIVTGFREAGLSRATLPLYRRLLGTAFDKLPKPIRDMHETGPGMTARGEADVERGTGLLARGIGWLFGFPGAGQGVPLSVRFDVDGDSEVWTRTFGDRSFSSRQEEGRGRMERLLVERFGPFAFGLALVTTGDGATGGGRLRLVVRRWSVLGLPLPRRFAPYGEAFEAAEDGKFVFDVDIRLPLVGRIVRYRGMLAPAVGDDRESTGTEEFRAGADSLRRGPS